MPDATELKWSFYDRASYGSLTNTFSVGLEAFERQVGWQKTSIPKFVFLILIFKRRSGGTVSG
ncbi:MAG: hypothetical protein QXL01_05545 [Thermoplasmatales archaeon]